MSDSQQLSRRRFLQQSFAFSAASMLAGCGSGLHSTAVQDPVLGGVLQVLMVGDWGTAGSTADQSSVAAAMQAYAAKYKIEADALFLLGDNFYGSMPGGVNSSRWTRQFENMYPEAVFPGPAFAIPGNHDYQFAPGSKVDAQLAYGQAGNSRWTMPGHQYSFVLPPQNPLVTFVALDSNMPNEPAQPYPFPDASYYSQTDAARQAQNAYLESVLSQPLATPFLVVLGHHPMYSNGPHGDNQTLIRDWDPLFRKYGVHLYLAGHDHDLQHIEFGGHPTSFVSSGGGGAELNTLGSRHAGFGQEAHGFTHLQVKSEIMTVRHLDVSGNLLHKFTKTPAGVVTIVK